jgi:hypothetical protein
MRLIFAREKRPVFNGAGRCAKFLNYAAIGAAHGSSSSEHGKDKQREEK